MRYTKGAPHLLNPFVHFFCVAQKKWTKEKGAAARCLSGEFLAPALPDAAVARVESDFVGRFSGFFSSFIFIRSALRTLDCHLFII
jgi:hypothetical protein